MLVHHPIILIRKAFFSATVRLLFIKVFAPKAPRSCGTSLICGFFPLRDLQDVTPSRFSVGLWLHDRGFSRFLFLWKWTPFKKCYISRQGTPANLGHFICLFLLQVCSGLSIRIILKELPHWLQAADGLQIYNYTPLKLEGFHGHLWPLDIFSYIFIDFQNPKMFISCGSYVNWNSFTRNITRYCWDNLLL